MLYGVEASIARTALIPPAAVNFAGAGLLRADSNVTSSIPTFAAYTVPGAVRFNGSAWLQRGAPLTGVATTQTSFIFSCWTRLTNAGNGLFSDGTNYFSQAETTLNGYDFFYFDATLSTGDNAYFDSMYLQGGADPQGAPIISSSWQHVLASLDRTIPAASFRINNVDVFDYDNYTFGTSTSFTVNTDFFFGDDSFGTRITGDIAEVQLWLGQYADFSNPANVAYFYSPDGSPVDPANAAARFGQQTILFSGNSANFITNQGTGGAFTLNGSLTSVVGPGGLSVSLGGVGQLSAIASITAGQSQSVSATLSGAGQMSAAGSIATPGLVVLTDTGLTSWQVPSDFTAVNTIECWGAGGSGGAAAATASGGSGGGGGGYSKISNLSLTPGNFIDIGIGVGGTAITVTSGNSANGNDGGDTWFNGSSVASSSCGAKGGVHGVGNFTLVTGGAGGAAASGVGDQKQSGGRGGNAITSQAQVGTGGGGAGGPDGDGNNGVDVTAGYHVGRDGGSGDAGSGGSAGTGGQPNGTAGGTSNKGGGGGGGAGYSGAAETAGSGGGYGGGGGGCGQFTGSGNATTGAGANGAIIITYVPS